jgi:hypothetical protein
MTANTQYVGFKSKTIVREYSFLLRECLIAPHEIIFTILNEAFRSPWFTLSRCAGPLLTEASSRDGQLR